MTKGYVNDADLNKYILSNYKHICLRLENVEILYRTREVQKASQQDLHRDTETEENTRKNLNSQ